MRLVVVGGSKGTGAELATASVAAGHEVTVLSRSGTGPTGARVVQGSATGAAAVRTALAGADAVAITVGGAKGAEHSRTDVTRAVVAGMQELGVRRLVVQTSLGAGNSLSQLPLVLRPIVKVVLATPLQDHNKQEALVRSSGLDWTIVRPAGLTNGPATGSWQVLRTDEPGTLRRSIPRADVAACMLHVLDDDASIGAVLGVSSRKGDR